MKSNFSQQEYLIERCSEVLNVHHLYSIFLLIKVFPLIKYINELTKAFYLSMTVAAFSIKFLNMQLVCSMIRVGSY